LARVLYFTRDYTPHDHRFLASLAETEYKIYFLRLERSGNQIEDRPIPSKIETIVWAGGGRPARLIDYPRLKSSLVQIIQRIQPDLVHAGPIQSCAFLTALTGFKPLISMSWGYDLLQQAHRNSFTGWITRYALRQTTVMVGDCKPVMNEAIRFGMAADRIVIFPWGVDLELFSPDYSPKASEDDFIILSTRNWEPLYGVEILARAFVEVAKERPEVKLILLGTGSQAGLLRSIFIQGGVSEQVDFRGPVSQVELPRIYRMADLYISASHVDGSSVSLMDALASGIPALVSDLPGNREWIQPGVQGWLFPDGDIDELANCIRMAINKRHRLKEMGIAARELAEERANWEENFSKLMKAYELALSVET
jgi:glycosyltransferase involved in cell wall biosynthesis